MVVRKTYAQTHTKHGPTLLHAKLARQGEQEMPGCCRHSTPHLFLYRPPIRTTVFHVEGMSIMCVVHTHTLTRVCVQVTCERVNAT